MIPFRFALFVITCAFAFLSGCGKKAETTQTNSHATNEAIARIPLAPVIQTNAEISDSKAVENVTNSVVALAANPARHPSQEVFEQAVAIVRTNASPGAAQEAVILFRAAAEKEHPAAQHALGMAFLGGLGIEKNAEEGLKWLQKSAANKNPDALFKLASLYAYGGEVPRDDAKAAELARAAAELGHVEAQYNLATLYATGQSVSKDLREAGKWFLRAAEAGHATAQSNLGVLYATGEGIERDVDQAVKWWQKAAEQGQPSAQFNLAHALREGTVLPKDLLEAYKWYDLAAQQGDREAARARDSLAVDMSPSDVAEALKRVRAQKTQWMTKWQESLVPE